MADKTHIEWTDATWNPITGCSVASPGCTNCYAMKLAGTRLKHTDSRKGLTAQSKSGPVWNGQVRFNEEWLLQPLEWKRPRMIFVCAHGDLFAENVPDEWVDKVFAVMALAPQHTFQVLTKRAERMRDYVRFRFGRILGATASMTATVKLPEWPLPNVWLGVSAEDQKRADERVPVLLETLAAVKWLSAEPLLGPIDLENIRLDNVISPFDALRGSSYQETRNGRFYHGRIERGHHWLDWVVVGGESGPGARPMHPAWVRSIRDQCITAGVPFFFKQWGNWVSIIDRDNDDPDWRADYSGRFHDRHPDIKWLNVAGGTGFHGDKFHIMKRVTKKSAGRALDGIFHDAYPEVRP